MSQVSPNRIAIRSGHVQSTPTPRMSCSTKPSFPLPRLPGLPTQTFPIATAATAPVPPASNQSIADHLAATRLSPVRVSPNRVPGPAAQFAGHTAGPCKPLPGLGSHLDIFEKSPVPVPKARPGFLLDPLGPRSAALVVRKSRDTFREPVRDNLSRTRPSALYAVA